MVPRPKASAQEGLGSGLRGTSCCPGAAVRGGGAVAFLKRRLNEAIGAEVAERFKPQPKGRQL
jgi:hypothetical protein